MAAYPPIRNVDATPVEHEGEQMICLFDPEGYVDSQIILSPPAFFVATCLDGQQDAVAIQQAFAQQFNGAPIEVEDIERIVSMLEEQGFLYTPEFEAQLQQEVQAYQSSKTRPAHLAGRSYPAEAEALRTVIDSYFTRDNGPGPLDTVERNGAAPLRGLLAPHIDFERGGHCYAHGYRTLYAAGKPKTVLLFGVAHHAVPAPFILTRKDFETPLGTLRVNQAMVDTLVKSATWDPFEYELTHQREHSIEFQAVMLAYLYGEDVEIVPILCSSIGMGTEADTPDSDASVAQFLQACKSLVEEHAGTVTVLAGVDLAHVGPCFGDAFEITDQRITEIHMRDQADLNHVQQMNAQGWYQAVMADTNARRVCGLGAIYATLKILEGEGESAELLQYDYAPDPSGGIVSFASIAIP